MTPTKMPDFYVQNEGTIFLLHPLTEEATFWIENNIPADALRWGDTVVVEHRYISDIIIGIERDGLVIVRAKHDRS
jgi:hypothetical protein